MMPHKRQRMQMRRLWHNHKKGNNNTWIEKYTLYAWKSKKCTWDNMKVHGYLSTSVALSKSGKQKKCWLLVDSSREKPENLQNSTPSIISHSLCHSSLVAGLFASHTANPPLTLCNVMSCYAMQCNAMLWECHHLACQILFRYSWKG